MGASLEQAGTAPNEARPCADARALFADLSGKSALVTGGSSGLGAHFASVLAAAGVRVALAARRADRIAAQAEAIRARGGVAAGFTVDVRDPDSVRHAVDRTITEFGGLDIIVNNAGTGLIKPALEHTEADWQLAIDTNLTGAWRVCQAAGQSMIGSGRGGSIVNIASLAGLGVTRSIPAYAASKSGLVHLTRQLALEWAREGVRVNCICPGHFPTELTHDQLSDGAVADKLAARVPLGRLGRLDDLDGALLLLASAASSYITGAVIPIDGGSLVRSL